MIRIAGLADVSPDRFRDPVVTLGVFDGVHLGHRRIIGEAVSWARDVRGTAVILTFELHPQLLLIGKSPATLTSLEHRLRLFESLGVDVVVTTQFDEALRDLAADAFVERILVGAFGSRRIVLGPTNTFGRGGLGNGDWLRQHAARFGIEVRVPDRVAGPEGPISSTRIRAAIDRGDLRAASAMLGRPVSVLGTVVRGDARGRTIGFPTANLDLHHEQRPPIGVYVTRAIVRGKAVPSVANIGVRPTFKRDGTQAVEAVVEVHLLNWDAAREIYGEQVEVEFLERVRDEKRFESVDALREQIETDREAARRWFAARPAESEKV
ncbi:MAG: riboflavin biosynthesis protein RibF [Planctomycetes bacterium]|nr:riboflavin biosynthesis protein RibF [Planctomycetota bacterium]MBI3843121.1 riboflavin biosynthesis protein RibF [Planctomycetota bacterium]